MEGSDKFLQSYDHYKILCKLASGHALTCLNKERVLSQFVIIIFVYKVPCIFWRYINVDEVSLITLKTLLQSAMELLQIATA